MNTKILEELGLTAGEIKTYLALLKLGSSSAGPIANQSGVSRSKIYGILDKLEKKGLGAHVEKNGVIYYQASEPAKIQDYIKEKEEQLQNIGKEFQQFLPQLEAFHANSGKIQQVKFYQGLKGIMTASEHVYLKLKKGYMFYCIGVPKYQPESHHLYWQRDHLHRIKAGIKCRLLFNKDTPKETLINRNSYKGCDARYMPTDIVTPSYTMIFGDTVLMAIPASNPPICIEIISQEIADSFKAYFEEFWKRSKKFK